MPIKYKINVLEELKKMGYNTNYLRENKILGESTIQNIRNGVIVSANNLSKICELLNCQPGDIIEHEEQK